MADFIGLSTRPVARATGEEKAFIAKYETVSAEEHRRIMLLDQHHADGTTNKEWLDARKHRFTGSTAGAGCHQNPYETQDDFLTKKVEQTPMDERGLAMCKWGNDHEDDAEAAFGQMIASQVGKPQKNGLTLLSWRIQHAGLYICKEPGLGFLGMSPDGILHTTWQKPDGTTCKKIELVEYKCPATWRNKIGKNPKLYKSEWVPRAVPTYLRDGMGELLQAGGLPHHEFRKKIPCPPYYYAQVQFGMELFSRSNVPMTCAHFVVWCPEQTAHTRIKRDPTYGKWLVDRLSELWKTRYVPRVVRSLRSKSSSNSSSSNSAAASAASQRKRSPPEESDFLGLSVKRKRLVQEAS